MVKNLAFEATADEIKELFETINDKFNVCCLEITNTSLVDQYSEIRNTDIG